MVAFIGLLEIQNFKLQRIDAVDPHLNSKIEEVDSLNCILEEQEQSLKHLEDSVHYLNEMMRRDYGEDLEYYFEIIKSVDRLGVDNPVDYLPIHPPLINEDFEITSIYGRRYHPIYKCTKQHEGIDFDARRGDLVIAAGSGIVEESKFKRGFGHYIKIDHGTTKTIYAHLSKRLVKEGERIVVGQSIGKVGSTGASTGSHLHFEIWDCDGPIDPWHLYTTYTNFSSK